jgi:hypothetical protein
VDIVVVGDTPLARREQLSRSGTEQTVWVKGGGDDQGFPFSVSVTV